MKTIRFKYAIQEDGSIVCAGVIRDDAGESLGLAQEFDGEGLESSGASMMDSIAIDMTRYQPLEISANAKNSPAMTGLPYHRVACTGWYRFLHKLSCCVINTVIFPVKAAWGAGRRLPTWERIGYFTLLQIMMLTVIDQMLQSFYQRQGVPLLELKEMDVARVDIGQLCLSSAFNFTTCGPWTNQTQAYWESHIPARGDGRHQDKLAQLFDCRICEPGRSDAIFAMEKTYRYIQIFLVVYGVEMSAILVSLALSLYQRGREELSRSLQQTSDDVRRLCQELESLNVDGVVVAQNKLSKTMRLQHWRESHEKQLQSPDVSFSELRVMMIAINSIRSKVQCQYGLDYEPTFPRPVSDYVHLPYRLSKTKVFPAPEPGVLVALCDLFSRKKDVHYHLMIHVMSFLSDYFSVFDAMDTLRHASYETADRPLSVGCGC